MDSLPAGQEHDQIDAGSPHPGLYQPPGGPSQNLTTPGQNPLKQGET